MNENILAVCMPGNESELSLDFLFQSDDYKTISVKNEFQFECFLDDIDDISIELTRTELTILSTKKKNNKMKEIKESVMDKLYEIVDEDDVELLFDINATKNNISILCKRKIEH